MESVIGKMYSEWNPSCRCMSIWDCVRTSGCHWLTRYVVWSKIVRLSEISSMSYGVSKMLLGVI